MGLNFFLNRGIGAVQPESFLLCGRTPTPVPVSCETVGVTWWVMFKGTGNLHEAKAANNRKEIARDLAERCGEKTRDVDRKR